MTLFLVAILVLAAGLLGTLFLLFRDARRGTKGLNVPCYRIGNERDRHLPPSHQAHVLTALQCSAFHG
jgi:hypothetical protein